MCKRKLGKAAARRYYRHARKLSRARNVGHGYQKSLKKREPAAGREYAECKCDRKISEADGQTIVQSLPETALIYQKTG